MIVALMCFAAGAVADNGGVFVGIGAFWLVMAIIIRSKSTKNSDEGGPNES